MAKVFLNFQHLQRPLPLPAFFLVTTGYVLLQADPLYLLAGTEPEVKNQKAGPSCTCSAVMGQGHHPLERWGRGGSGLGLGREASPGTSPQVPGEEL